MVSSVGPDDVVLGFPLSKLGLSSYFLAVMYATLTVHSFKRLRRVSGFVQSWSTHKLVHVLLFTFAVLRTLIFIVLCVLLVAVRKDEHNIQHTRLLVTLFLAPEFVFLIVYVLFFFNWLELYIFSHEQYIFTYYRFKRIWKSIFFLFSGLLLCGAIPLFIMVNRDFGDVIDTKHAKNIESYITSIYMMLWLLCMILPIVFYVSFYAIKWFVLSGFPYSSSIAEERVDRLSKAFHVWSFTRWLRSVLISTIFVFDPISRSISSDALMIIIVGSLVLTEVIPFNMITNWSTISLLLLSEEGDTYDRFESLHGQVPERQWTIDPVELQMPVSGLQSPSYGDTAFVSDPVKGSWRGQNVTITGFGLAEAPAVVAEELANEAASVPSSLHHPFIAQVHGTCVVGNSIFMVHEYLPRGSLRQLIDGSMVPFSTDVITRIAKQICSAMAHLHDQSVPCITHALLSPCSVMLNQDMDVKLINVGVQRVRVYAEVMHVMRFLNAYTAPELVGGSSSSRAVDIYSFGIILWELCTRQRAFAGRSTDWIRKHVHGRGVRPTVPTQIHPVLRDIIIECWSTHPSDRPSFAEILRLLEDVAPTSVHVTLE